VNTNLRSILVGLSLASILTGCAALDSVSDGSHRLDTGNYIVKFTPTKRSPADPWKTHYRVMKKGGSRQVHEVASGFHGDAPQSALGYSKDNVRLIESFDGKRLLIEEYIPNEAWVLKNYILISPSEHGSLEHSYLRIPEAPHEGTPNDPSTILSLDGEVLTFRYANGRIESRLLKDISRDPDPRDG
jgi:hypothetical protein